MEKAYSYLVEWSISYFKNRDLIFKKIESVEKSKGGFDFNIKFKDKEQFFIVKLIVDNDKFLERFDSEKHFGLVVANTKSNFDFVIKNWDKLVKFKHLCVYFFNPFSKLDKKWIVCPYTHNNICEKDALEKGIKSMFEMVEPLTEAGIRDTFK